MTTTKISQPNQTLTNWWSRQTPWKVFALGFGFMLLGILIYFTSLSHAPIWLPRWAEVVPDLIETAAVIYAGCKLCLKK